MAGHVANERCVLLNTKLCRQATQPNEVNIPVQLKVLTSGKLLSSVEPRTFTDTSVAPKPFSPAGLWGLVDTGGVNLRWQRRTRLAYRYGGMAPVVPLGEATESHRVQVSSGVTLLRTATVSTAAFICPPCAQPMGLQAASCCALPWRRSLQLRAQATHQP